MLYNIHYVDSIICLCFGAPDRCVRVGFYAVVLLGWVVRRIMRMGFSRIVLRCGDFLMRQCGVVSLGIVCHGIW